MAVRILDFITHPPSQYELCKTGHEFHLAPSECWDHWDGSLRPLPENAAVVNGAFAGDGFDLAIVATREQYRRVATLSLPVIFLSHTILHPWDREFFAALPPETAMVYVSEHKRATFGELGERGRTIRLAVDTENEFHSYGGETASVLNVTNRFAQQGDRGFELFRELTAGLPCQVVGHDNAQIEGAIPARDFEHLKCLYREHRAYLNTDPQGRLHLSTLEAMATGMPLVSPPIAELGPYVEHGRSAFVSSDIDELRDALEQLLADPDLAMRVGQAGRDLVRHHFGLDRFLREWDELIREATDQADESVAAAPPRSAEQRPLKVAINAGSVGTIVTGIGHHTTNLLAGIESVDSQNDYHLVRGDGPGDGLPEGERFRHIIVRGAGGLWEQTALPALLEELGVDVYHNPAFGLPIVKPCGFVATVHDCIPRLFPQYSPAFLREFFERWAPTWMQLADHLIAVSEHTKRDVMHLYGVPEDKVTVVYQASPQCRRIEDEPEIDAVKQRLGVDGPYLLFVGRIELRKNVPGLVQAVRLLKARGLFDGRLVLAGPRDADVYDPQGQLPPSGHHGDVTVTGFVSDDDLSALYSGATAFCFPSFYEGFGLPVLEALCCGTPVVTSGVSSLPEVGGDAALYANPHDPDDIAAGLERVLGDESLRSGMIERGLAHAGTFSATEAARQTVAVYESVGRGRSSGSR